MKFRRTFITMPLAAFAAFVLVLTGTNTALAHVTVKPGEVVTAAYQVFTVSVPNEKEIPTVSVKVAIPEGVTSVTPTLKEGWNISTEKEDGSEGAVTSITWSGGRITDGTRSEFTFSAKTPDQATELHWKAYQTYSDGTVVSWDKEEDGDSHGQDGNSGPFSVTSVTTDAESEVSAQTVSDAQASADRALYVAIAGVGVGLIAVFLATRKS